jgi:hypothetical protein
LRSFVLNGDDRVVLETISMLLLTFSATDPKSDLPVRMGCARIQLEASEGRTDLCCWRTASLLEIVLHEEFEKCMRMVLHVLNNFIGKILVEFVCSRWAGVGLDNEGSHSHAHGQALNL